MTSLNQNTPLRSDRQCEALLKHLPCAFYILSEEPDFPIFMVNDAFYKLTGLSSNDIKFRYGNHLSAIFSTAPYLRFLRSGADQTSFEHLIRIEDRSYTFYTCICRSTVPNYLLCTSLDVSAYVADRLQYEHMKHITQTVFGQLFCEIFDWNTGEDLVMIHHSNVILSKLPPSATLDELTARLKIVFCGEDNRRELTLALSRAKQLNSDVSCDLTYTGQKHQNKWCKLTLISHKMTGHVIGVLKDITEEKEASLKYLDETQFYHMFLSDQTAYAHVDITDNQVLTTGGLWKDYNKLADTMSYTDILNIFIQKNALSDDSSRYQELMSLKNLNTTYGNGVQTLGFEFRRKGKQGKITRMEIHIRMSRNPITGHLMSLMYLTEMNPSVLQTGPEDYPCDLPAVQAMEHESLSSFESFLGKEGDMAYLVDPDTYDMLYANQAFYDRAGLSPETCKKSKCYEVIHHRTSPCPFCCRQNWSADEFFPWKDTDSAIGKNLLIKHKLININGKQALLALAIDLAGLSDKLITSDAGAFEYHFIIDGIRSMEDADTTRHVVSRALNCIGHFFQSDLVSFWKISEEADGYVCSNRWVQESVDLSLSKQDTTILSKWLNTRTWTDSLSIDSPLSMLSYSMEISQMMTEKGVKNHRWVLLSDQQTEYGCIAVVNCKTNFSNTTFLATFSAFLISELKRRRILQSLTYVQNHDSLTGLRNRVSFDTYISRYDPDNVTSTGVLVANIDNLRGINATSGTATGNYYLKRFAKLLKGIFDEDEIYRLSGDEFLVISTDVGRIDFDQRLKAISHMISEQEDFTVSAGYIWDNVEKNIKEMIETATDTMKINKQKHYDMSVIPNDLERSRLIRDLIEDIQDHFFHIYLQPKFNMRTQELIGAEALIRRIDKKKNIIPPADFIPMLESNGLVRYIDLFVLEEVCKLLERWKKESGAELLLSLNFSRVTLLEEGILDNVRQILSRYAISTVCIEIEITENAAAGGKNTLSRVTQGLSQMGCHLSLDDFGIKYTNLSMLGEIRFQTLKLDKSLTKSIEEKNSNQTILKNIIQLCKDLEIGVIAEGIETETQKEILLNLGCDEGQGYLFGKPMPIEDFEAKYLVTPPFK